MTRCEMYTRFDNYIDSIRPLEQCQCVNCGESFNRKYGLNDDGFYCGFRCWYLDDNIGSMKRELIVALKNGKALNWLDANSENFSPSTYSRFNRAIQNRINEKAAQVLLTLKAA